METERIFFNCFSCLFRVETDIVFGNRQGATTLLVFSGATTEKHLDQLRQDVARQTTDREILPDFCVKDVGHFYHMIQLNSNVHH